MDPQRPRQRPSNVLKAMEGACTGVPTFLRVTQKPRAATPRASSSRVRAEGSAWANAPWTLSKMAVTPGLRPWRSAISRRGRRPEDQYFAGYVLPPLLRRILKPPDTRQTGRRARDAARMMSAFGAAPRCVPCASLGRWREALGPWPLRLCAPPRRGRAGPARRSEGALRAGRFSGRATNRTPGPRWIP